MKIVDLSVALDPDLPCWWPGLEPFSVTPTLTLEQGGSFSRNMHLEEHAGTHMDARCHVADENGEPLSRTTADLVPLQELAGRARVLDARAAPIVGPGVSSAVGLAELERHEREHGALRAGDVLLIQTEWSDRHYQSFPAGERYINLPLSGDAPAWPAPTPALIEAVARRGVRTIGVDAPTIGLLPDLALSHRAAFRHGITPIENLTNLGAIAGLDAWFVFLPLPITRSSGAPGRAIALVEEDKDEFALRP
jgi:isatin hydrolase